VDTVTIYADCPGCGTEYEVTAHIQPAEPAVGIARGYASELEGLPEACDCGHRFDRETVAENAWEAYTDQGEPDAPDPADEEPDRW
jgi:hypothetical protein